MTTDLFGSGFVAPDVDLPTSVGGGVVLTTRHPFLLIDDGTIPSTAVITNVQVFATAGAYTPGIIPATIQPYLLWQLTEWAGIGIAVPPNVGLTAGSNDALALALTPKLLTNPISGTTWTRADLFQASWGWWGVWNNIATSTPQAAQTLQVTQFVVRVVYDVPTQPAPIVGSIDLVTLTEVPETYTFRISGSNIEDGSSVLLTPPAGDILTITGAAVLRTVPNEIDWVVTAAQIGLAGSYSVQILGPTGQLSNVLTFDMAGPGVIVVASPGVMHVYGYACVRPDIPNTTNAPLGLAPDAQIDVFVSTTLDRPDLFADRLGTVPLNNPFNADDNAFWECYIVPAAIDVQFSGGGIDVPYTIGDYLPLDPRIPALETAVTTLEADATAAVATIAAAVAGVQTVPLAFPLGGSLTVGLENATRVDVADAVTLLLNAALFGSYVVTVFVTLKTDDAGTSVQAVLRNVDDGLDVGTSAVSVSTTGEVLSFTATLTPGSKHYRLQLQPGNANAYLYATGYLQLAAS